MSFTSWGCELPDESSSAFVRRSLVTQLSTAQASAAEAARDLVMLTAVGEAGLDLASACHLRSADEKLRHLLTLVAPDVEAVQVDWDTFLRRLGQDEPESPAAGETTQSGGGEAGVREHILAVLAASGEKYFTPNSVFVVLRENPPPGYTDLHRLRKAVQNAVSAMAKSRVITRRDRGVYIAPGRENDPDPEDHFPGDAGTEERTSDTLAGGGTGWFAEGGPHDTSEEAPFGYSANGSHSARSAA
ncbi:MULTISPECIES: hypothetical protein [unclassified Streptomyces]|uniref:hypothetical protein n=1 Tax=unclassified Streptomyces TaxID=2593676 RepID=UPI00382E294F